MKRCLLDFLSCRFAVLKRGHVAIIKGLKISAIFLFFSKIFVGGLSHETSEGMFMLFMFLLFLIGYDFNCFTFTFTFLASIVWSMREQCILCSNNYIQLKWMSWVIFLVVLSHAFFILLHTESLKNYFSRFGEVADVVVMREPGSKKPRYGTTVILLRCMLCWVLRLIL